MSWKHLLCPLASITCNLFLLGLINEQILPWLYCSVQQIILSYRKYQEKSKCRLHLSTEVYSNVTPGASSAGLRMGEKHFSAAERRQMQPKGFLSPTAGTAAPFWTGNDKGKTNAHGQKRLLTEGRFLSAISNGLGSVISLVSKPYLPYCIRK